MPAPAPMFVMVVTRSLDKPENVRRQRVNYNRPQARHWLAKHMLWGLMHKHSVLVYEDNEE